MGAAMTETQQARSVSSDSGPMDPDRVSPHWAVTVYRGGEPIVTIESNCLSGRDIDPEDEDAIRTAAKHLLAFIGDGSA